MELAWYPSYKGNTTTTSSITKLYHCHCVTQNLNFICNFKPYRFHGETNSVSEIEKGLVKTEVGYLMHIRYRRLVFVKV